MTASLFLSRLLPLVLLAFASPSNAAADTVRVPAEYPNIQMAIDSAAAGDTVRISSGTYRESVWVPRSKSGLRLRGAGEVILDPTGGRPGAALKIDASHVIVENITVRHASTGRLGAVTNDGVGVHVSFGADGVQLRNVTALGCDFAGFHLEGRFATTTGCRAVGGEHGFVISGEDGRLASREIDISPWTGAGSVGVRTKRPGVSPRDRRV